jgi:hypothetical protein
VVETEIGPGEASSGAGSGAMAGLSPDFAAPCRGDRKEGRRWWLGVGEGFREEDKWLGDGFLAGDGRNGTGGGEQGVARRRLNPRLGAAQCRTEEVVEVQVCPKGGVGG